MQKFKLHPFAPFAPHARGARACRRIPSPRRRIPCPLPPQQDARLHSFRLFSVRSPSSVRGPGPAEATGLRRPPAQRRAGRPLGGPAERTSAVPTGFPISSPSCACGGGRTRSGCRSRRCACARWTRRGRSSPRRCGGIASCRGRRDLPPCACDPRGTCARAGPRVSAAARRHRGFSTLPGAPRMFAFPPGARLRQRRPAGRLDAGVPGERAQLLGRDARPAGVLDRPRER